MGRAGRYSRDGELPNGIFKFENTCGSYFYFRSISLSTVADEAWRSNEAREKCRSQPVRDNGKLLQREYGSQIFRKSLRRYIHNRISQ
jgi:hypothetical protein